MPVCWSCGKMKQVNHSGICKVCWEKYAHLRKNKLEEGVLPEQNDDEYFERMVREAGGD